MDAPASFIFYSGKNVLHQLVPAVPLLRGERDHRAVLRKRQILPDDLQIRFQLAFFSLSILLATTTNGHPESRNHRAMVMSLLVGGWR